jgi:hypothetical protein
MLPVVVRHRAFTDREYQIRRKFLSSRSTVYDSEGQPVLFATRRAIGFDGDMRGRELMVRIFEDEQHKTELLRIFGALMPDKSASFEVTLPSTGERLGNFRAETSTPLFNLGIYDQEDRYIGRIMENISPIMLFNLLPYVLTFALPHSYHIKTGDKMLRAFRRHLNPRVYKLDVDTSEAGFYCDKGLLVAAGLLLANLAGERDRVPPSRQE